LPEQLGGSGILAPRGSSASFFVLSRSSPLVARPRSRRARIEPAIGAVRIASDLAKDLLDRAIIAFLEHEGGNAEAPELAGGVDKSVGVLFHGITDEGQGSDFEELRLLPALDVAFR
jgi:hypothetical protein